MAASIEGAALMYNIGDRAAPPAPSLLPLRETKFSNSGEGAGAYGLCARPFEAYAGPAVPVSLAGPWHDPIGPIGT